AGDPQDQHPPPRTRLDAGHGERRAIRRIHAYRAARLTSGDVVRKPIIAIAIGDPAGIGPELSLKTALDPAVQEICRPVLVGDPTVIARHAAACALSPELRMVDRL